MARKRKVGKVKHRRKRVGASKSGMFEILIGTVLGAVVGRVAYTSVTGLPPYVMGVSQFLVGGGLGYFMGDMPIARGIGFGLLASGAEITATEVIPGMSGVTDFGTNYGINRRIAGTRDVPTVGNFPQPQAVGKMAYKAM